MKHQCSRRTSSDDMFKFDYLDLYKKMSGDFCLNNLPVCNLCEFSKHTVLVNMTGINF